MAQQAAPQKEGHVAHVLPPLPYATDALEPYIDKMTMEIHHGKHHGGYVNNLNKAIESVPALAGKTVEELLANNCSLVPENIRTAVRNNAGGHANHSLFWTIMGPDGGGAPGEPLHEVGADALALARVDDLCRDVGGLGAAGVTDEAADGDGCAAAVERDERDVVAAVGGGEVAALDLVDLPHPSCVPVASPRSREPCLHDVEREALAEQPRVGEHGRRRLRRELRHELVARHAEVAQPPEAAEPGELGHLLAKCRLLG